LANQRVDRKRQGVRKHGDGKQNEDAAGQIRCDGGRGGERHVHQQHVVFNDITKEQVRACRSHDVHEAGDALRDQQEQAGGSGVRKLA